jgi:hypothetical protein
MTLPSIPRLFTLVLLAYAAYALLVFLLQRQLLYPGRYVLAGGPPPAGIEPVPVITATAQGEAWFMPPLNRAKGQRHPLAIVFHGNGEVIDSLPGHFEEFRELGMAVLLVEYPGYGGSSGSPGEKSITDTAVAAYDAALMRPEVDPQRIVLFGRSLGCAAACALAARRPSAALILQSAFTSIRPFARGFCVPPFLVRDVFDNAKVLTSYQQPVLLFHGSYDTKVPPEHSRRLVRLAPHARLIEYPCGHNDFPPDRPEFYRAIASFLRDAGVLPGS